MYNLITIYESKEKVSQPHYITLDKAIERIKGGKQKHKIYLLRNESDKEKRNKIKGSLSAYSFSGKFRKRADSEIEFHSGLVCLDFDHIKNVKEFKDKICLDKFVHVAFVSPSGDGLKVIVRIPANIETHARSVEALGKHFKIKELDLHKDLSRLCFEGFDDELYYNPDSEVFEELAPIPVFKVEKLTVKETESDQYKIYDNLKKWLDKKGEYYQEGNRNNYVMKLGAACCRFGIDETTCYQLASTELSAISPMPPREMERTIKSAYRSTSSNFGTAEFEKEKIIEKKSRLDISKEITDLNIPPKDVIRLDDIADKMLDGFKNGLQKGETTYFKLLDECFRWMRGEVTVLSGIGNYGKSTFINQLCVLKSINEDARWGIFSPEQNPPTYFYNDLIQIYTGKSTDGKSYNSLTELEYIKAMEFIDKHFFYIYPEKESPTPDYINQRFLELIIKYEIDGCITDPFNMLDNDWGKQGRDDRYIGDFLSKEKRFALENNVYKIILVHPNSSIPKHDNGNFKVPSVYNLAGGAMWNNKCDNILCLHRPNYVIDPSDTLCEFYSQKIKKQKLNGIPGKVEFDFDRITNRYKERGNESPFKHANWYEKEEKETIDNPQHNPF